jgi:hypothetical protein
MAYDEDFRDESGQVYSFARLVMELSACMGAAFLILLVIGFIAALVWA